MANIKRLILLLSYSTCFFISCTSQKKAEYEFPEQMLPQVKEAYTKQCDKGQILFKLNCAKCHTTKINGKKTIPDFKPEQLIGYGLRLTNARHMQNLTDTTVSEEELGLIMTFLGYKKKNPSSN